MPHASVAIITRTKNRPLLLRRAVESVLGQEFGDWLHVIVNDGGDAAVVDALLAEYPERYQGRLVLLHHPESLGMEAASNRGIEAVESEYIAIHDDDDSWKPGFLSQTVGYLQSPEGAAHAGVVTDIERITERIEGESVTELAREPCPELIGDLSLWQLARDNLFPPIAFLYKRAVYAEIGGTYRESLPVQGDWEFNLRFFLHFSVGHLHAPLAGYHHRIANEGHAIYGNTVIEKVPLHWQTQAAIRSAALREDMATGRFGKGALLALAGADKQREHQLSTLQRDMQSQLAGLNERLHGLEMQAQQEQKRLQAAVEQARAEAEQLRTALMAMRQSSSWRFTAPLRAITRRLRRA